MRKSVLVDPSEPEPLAGSSADPLVVKPRRACQLLACGNTRLYELLAAGELQSFKDGKKSRKIVVRSIVEYINRRIVESEV
jgi:hypothetical protein